MNPITDLNAFSSLVKAIKAVCPIASVAIVDAAAHIYSIKFQSSATDKQQADANNVVATFDWSDDAQAVREKVDAREKAKDLLNSPDPQFVQIRMIVHALLDYLNSVLPKVGLPTISYEELEALAKQKGDGGVADPKLDAAASADAALVI